jgi:hypothetical protein
MANIQLTSTKDEAKLLRQTLEACNAACNAASQLGFEKFGPKKVRQFNLQKNSPVSTAATKPLLTLLVP